MQNLWSTRGKFFTLVFFLFLSLTLTLNQVSCFPKHPDAVSNHSSKSSLRNISLFKVTSTSVPLQVPNHFFFLKFPISKYLLLSNSLPTYFPMFLPQESTDDGSNC